MALPAQARQDEDVTSKKASIMVLPCFTYVLDWTKPKTAQYLTASSNIESHHANHCLFLVIDSLMMRGI